MDIQRNHPRFFSCLIAISVILLLLITAVIVIPRYIVGKAESTFGPPAQQLGSLQRIYLSTLILLKAKELSEPAHPGTGEVSITIDPGESTPSIISKLWEAGLISNPGVFTSYLQYTGQDTTLKSGDYRLDPALSPLEIAREIQSSVSPDITLSILPGWRLEEVANALPSSGFTITPDEFISISQGKPEGFSFSTCQANSSLEGFLFPGSYTVPREISLGGLLTQILMNYEIQVTSELRNGFTSQGMDLCQATTLASVVQREAVIVEEMPLIASVFYNRYRSGNRLESDPTVQFALGFNQEQSTWWTNPLSLGDLEVDSPYNTYMYAGLPPGPISNPGLSALRAVAFPDQSPYFYFRSACDGSGRHSFSETFAEHVANQCP